MEYGKCGKEGGEQAVRCANGCGIGRGREGKYVELQRKEDGYGRCPAVLAQRVRGDIGNRNVRKISMECRRTC